MVIFIYTTFVLLLHTIVSALWLKWTELNLSIFGVLFFIVIQGISLQLSFSICELLLSIFLPLKGLSYLNELNATPNIAILYTVCDDLDKDALSELSRQDYINYKIFVLDDSERYETKQKINELAEYYNFTIVRRKSRSGYKAGNLNNWLKLYSKNFDYFIVADSDSKFFSSFIRDMLKYGEHPSNYNVIVFQSKLLYWNTNMYYPKVMSTIQPISNFCIEKLSQNDLIYSLYGRNSMYRTAKIFEVGGFPEDYIAEDFALQLRLREKGYLCRIVNIVSYEAYPAILKYNRKRMQRWACQTIQLLKYQSKRIPLPLIIASIRNAHYYLVWPFYLLGLCLFFASSLLYGEFNLGKMFNNFVIGINFLFHPVAIFLIGIFLFQIIIRAYLALKLKIPLMSYLKHCLYSMAEGFYLIVPVSFSIIHYLIFTKLEFNPTQSIVLSKKDRAYNSLWLIIFYILWFFTILTVIIMPINFILNSFWLIPALLSPILLWRFDH